MEKSVLLVDDKQEIAKIIMLYLSSTYKVSYKENPVKAIAWLQEGNFRYCAACNNARPARYPTPRSRAGRISMQKIYLL